MSFYTSCKGGILAVIELLGVVLSCCLASSFRLLLFVIINFKKSKIKCIHNGIIPLYPLNSQFSTVLRYFHSPLSWGVWWWLWPYLSYVLLILNNQPRRRVWWWLWPWGKVEQKCMKTLFTFYTYIWRKLLWLMNRNDGKLALLYQRPDTLYIYIHNLLFKSNII